MGDSADDAVVSASLVSASRTGAGPGAGHIDLYASAERSRLCCSCCVLNAACASLLTHTPGYPDNNASLWCDHGASMCYQLSMQTANYSMAADKCDAQGGVLWWPRNASEELAVERWFGLLNQRGGIYLGIARGAASGIGSTWTAADGSSTVVSYPSTSAGQPYAHWGYDHHSSGGPASDGNQLCTYGQTWSIVGGWAAHRLPFRMLASLLDGVCWHSLWWCGNLLQRCSSAASVTFILAWLPQARCRVCSSLSRSDGSAAAVVCRRTPTTPAAARARPAWPTAPATPARPAWIDACPGAPCRALCTAGMCAPFQQS